MRPFDDARPVAAIGHGGPLPSGLVMALRIRDAPAHAPEGSSTAASADSGR
jgi:hypothetical protein